MDSRPTIAIDSTRPKPSRTITSALVSALLEWVLILMLYVDASFSYLVTKFARFSGLQVPCLLCSRLEHVLSRGKHGFYWELVCCNHQLEISSLISSRLHNNVVDRSGTCESCLLSTKSNVEANGIRAGVPHDGHGSDQATSLYDHSIAGTRKCTSCDEECIPRTRSYSKSVSSEQDEVTVISSQREHASDKDMDPLPPMESEKIMVTSDTISEDSSFGNESACVHFHQKETSGQDSSVKRVPPELTPVDCPDVEKLIHPVPAIKSSNSSANIDSDESFGRVSEPTDYNNNVSETSDHVSFPERVSSPTMKDIHHEEPRGIDISRTSELENEYRVECEEVPNLGSSSAGTAKCGETSTAEANCIQENEIEIDVKPNKIDVSTQIVDSFDLGDAYRLAVGTRGRQLSGKLYEQQKSMTDSTRASEDLKLLLSQISARGMECPLYDVSPRVSATNEDFKAVDASCAAGMQILQRRISLERNESNLSFDGSVVSEIEGESVADRLKRQVEYDKKIMSTLYKELEEERSASAIAANQAMAMITRLQEEKSTLHMEALQCVRLMEEQAEYDDEALQKANDLLAEKEKQIQILEFEIRMYKNQFGNISPSNTISEACPESEDCGLKEQEVEAHYEESSVLNINIFDEEAHNSIDDDDGTTKVLDRYDERVTLPELEDEKQIIFQYLKKLEEKLIPSSTRDIYPDVAYGDSPHRKEETLPADAVIHRETSSEDPSRLNTHEDEEHDKYISGKHNDRGAELDAFRRELLAMNSRLEALEAEQNVIETSINSLEKGSEGLEFIREISGRVQELHSAYIRRSEDSI